MVVRIKSQNMENVIHRIISMGIRKRKGPVKEMGKTLDMIKRKIHHQSQIWRINWS